MTQKGNTVTLKLNIKGSKKFYRDQYKENTYLAKCVADLREKIDGLSEMDAAWGVAQWVEKHSVYDDEYYLKGHCKPSDFWKKGGWGVCWHLAIGYQQFACLMGIDAATVYDNDTNLEHAFNAVKIDGKKYYVEIQSVELLEVEWDRAIETSDEKIPSRFDGLRTWTEDTTIGEWCLMTSKEWEVFYVDTNDLDVGVEDFKYYWNLGTNWQGSSDDWI